MVDPFAAYRVRKDTEGEESASRGRREISAPVSIR